MPNKLQKWRGRPRDDCLGAAQMFNAVLELRSLKDNDFLDSEITMLDGFLEFSLAFAQKTPDITCMVAYIAQYREVMTLEHLAAPSNALRAPTTNRAHSNRRC